MAGNLDSVYTDPTLEAVHRAVEARENAKPARSYLVLLVSAICASVGPGISLRVKPPVPWKAETLFRVQDGHRTEALVIERLRMVPGLQVWDRDEATGEQIGGFLYDGKFGWHADGVVKGLLQSPVTPHVLEVKCVNPKKYQEFVNVRQKLGDKATLNNWDFTYYVQALVYMHLLDLSRHYLVVACPVAGR